MVGMACCCCCCCGWGILMACCCCMVVVVVVVVVILAFFGVDFFTFFLFLPPLSNLSLGSSLRLSCAVLYVNG